MTATPPLRTTILALLADLGDSPEAVAASLLARGIRGQRQNVHQGPLARYLRSNLPVMDLWIGGYSSVVFGDITHEQYVPLSPAVAMFEREWTEGGYPELEEKGA